MKYEASRCTSERIKYRDQIAASLLINLAFKYSIKLSEYNQKKGQNLMKSVSADSYWTFYWGDIKREGDSSGATETSAKTTAQKVANKNSFYDENQRDKVKRWTRGGRY